MPYIDINNLDTASEVIGILMLLGFLMSMVLCVVYAVVGPVYFEAVMMYIKGLFFRRRK